MTSHELARKLLALPNLPVVHWTASVGDELYEVSEVGIDEERKYRVEHITIVENKLETASKEERILIQ